LLAYLEADLTYYF